MPTNFPTSVDNFTNPTANDSLNLPSHSTQHANANDAIEAVEDYLLNGAGKAGLVLLKTQVVGTAVSSVTVSNAFNATYENYLIQVVGNSSSVNNVLFMTINGSAGSTYQSAGYYISYGTATLNAVANAIGSQGFRLSEASASGNNSFNVNVFRPFTNTLSSYISQGQNEGNVYNYQGKDTNTASSTNFTITTSSGTISGGTIYVYGYKAA